MESTQAQTVAFRDLGRLEWDAAMAEQERVADALARGDGPETVLFVEHEPVYTHGLRFRPENFRDDFAAARDTYKGIPVRGAWRGGELTYHGPGQLAVYPIVRLPRGGGSLHRLVRAYQDVILAVAAELGVEAFPKDDAIGVWAERGKIASIGVGLRRGITRNGFAINVEVDRRAFEPIVPCGRPGDRVASLNDFLSERISVDDVRRLVEKHLIRAGDIMPSIAEDEPI